MKKIKNIIFQIFLSLIFKSKVYISSYVQSCIKLQMIIFVNGKILVVDNQDYVKLPSVEVDLQKKHSFVFTVKRYLKENISKKINVNNYITLNFIDSYREMIKTDKESHLFVDNIYIKLNLEEDLPLDELEDNVRLVSLNDLKLLQFKNKFHTFDYKLVLQAQKEKGIEI